MKSANRGRYFSRFEARGTVRIAVNQNGRITRKLTSLQVGAIVKHVLPAELKRRGVECSDEICREISDVLNCASFRIPTGLAHEVVSSRVGG